jgi:diaminopimelate epimerase
MRIRFTKMHGLGNDFVVIDGISQKIKLSPDKIRALSDRRFGVGCDQVLLVEIPESPDCDFRYRIYNYDGSEVENCGNGARCFARFVQDRKLSGKNCIKVETAGGILTLNVLGNGDVCVDMGEPKLSPAEIPFVAEQQASQYQVAVDSQVFGVDTLQLAAVSMGNPHAVIVVDDVDTAAVETWGEALQNHSAFPNKVNVGFLQILSRSEVRLRVFERGVGETLACGTGACAAVVAGHLQGLLDTNVRITLPGGSMDIDWQGPGHTVLMTGPASSVFHGQIKI